MRGLSLDLGLGLSKKPLPALGGSGGSPYVGPLDIDATAVYAVSTARALSSAKRGSAVYTLREDGGETTQSFSSDAATGAVSIDAVTSFLDGADGFVTTLRDQSANALDVAEATADNQPQWLASGPNGKPCISYRDSGAPALASSDNLTVADGFLTFAVVRLNGTALQGGLEGTSIWGINGNDLSGPGYITGLRVVEGSLIHDFADDNTGFESGGKYDAQIPYDQFVLIEGLNKFGFSDGYLNGAQADVIQDFDTDGVPATISLPLAVGGEDAILPQPPESTLYGELVELLIFSPDVSGADRTAIRQNIADYYGITLPGGGGGVPEWVPDNAKIFIEPRIIDGFPTGRAWTEADGIVAIDTLLGSDPNTENYWDVTEYSADNLTVNGYASSEPPAFIGVARSAVSAGSTISIKFFCESDLSGSPLVLMSADGNSAIEIDNAGQRIVEAYSNANYDRNSDPILNEGTNVINALAATLLATRAEFAVNGSTVYADILSETDWPTSGDSQIVAALIDVSGVAVAIQSITVYDPLPDTDGLSALSETSVTNTAPHDVSFAWQSADASSGADATYGAAAFVTADITPVVVANLTATDDEGNPLTWTLTDSDGGNFTIEAAALSVANVLTAVGSPYSGTIRATDPGGLYVEQVFTVTVTA